MDSMRSKPTAEFYYQQATAQDLTYLLFLLWYTFRPATFPTPWGCLIQTWFVRIRFRSNQFAITTCRPPWGKHTQRLSGHSHGIHTTTRSNDTVSEMMLMLCLGRAGKRCQLPNIIGLNMVIHCCLFQSPTNAITWLIRWAMCSFGLTVSRYW